VLLDWLKLAFPWGPVLFGIGFVAPVLAQSMDGAGLSAPAGLSNLQLGLLVGILWGTFAKFRGRWV
jgi:hypothetical protein